MAFDIWSVAPVVAFVLNVALAAYVLRRSPRAPANRAFSLWAGLVAVWVFGKIWMWAADDAATSALWGRFSQIGFTLIAPAFASFALKLTGRKFNAALLWLPFILLLALLPTDLYIQGASYHYWGYSFVVGALYPVFGALYVAGTSYASYILYRAYRGVPEGLAKRKFRMMLYPTIGTFAYISVFEVTLPILGIYLYAIPGIVSSLRALSIAYAFSLKD